MHIFFWFAFALFSVSQVIILLRLYKKKQKTGVRATAAGFSVLVLLVMIAFLLKLRVSYITLLLSLAALFINSFAGYYLNLYERSRVADRYIHCFGTFALTLLTYDFLLALKLNGGSILFQVLFVFFLGIALGTIHEVIEFLSDLRHNSTMQKGLRDTNLDTVFNILGAAAAAAAAYFFMI